ncbi:hypothetical protein [Streptomyces hilarionis]|uniref:hypothetical protein n=1 Tax=Streptomyces hilarionis TaxID=2839954 RepID=UPI002119E60D|nr:hypothetical protein [Streptomyces hilarionis]MCQ9133089.1 hypothetical protein [Streptomyces hilarionis]
MSAGAGEPVPPGRGPDPDVTEPDAGPPEAGVVAMKGARPEDTRQESTDDEKAGDETFDDGFDEEPLGVPTTDGLRATYNIYNSNVNTASVQGGQHVENGSGPPGAGGSGPHFVAHEGPVSPTEILDAVTGFAEPEWFPAALAELDGRVLFLSGEQGSGRRTAALNLLYRHTKHSMALRAVDNDEDLAAWHPTDTGTRGYLVDGLLPARPLKPGTVGNLRRLLQEADARMVIVLPDDPVVVRSLTRDLHVTPVRCAPPPPRALFEARLEAEVPNRTERDRLLAGLEPGLLDELLTDRLVPAQVRELVGAVIRTADGGMTSRDIRDRLSYLADEEIPGLLGSLRDDPDGLAFLLATCVFEGLDHRIVREQADRLLNMADGRLHSVLSENPDDRVAAAHGTGRRAGPSVQPTPGGSASSPQTALPNPRFVFRRSLEDLLRTVRAEYGSKEYHATYGYTYVVEPVRFTRHRQGEAVLRHVWREYGSLSSLLTSWMGEVNGESDVTRPAGRVMGMAARWGGGRRALLHIRELAGSDRATGRAVAAYALGMAAEDPVLAGEVKYRLAQWSVHSSWQVRWTVAHACGTGFGAARPDQAMRLLRNVLRNGTSRQERVVATAVRRSLLNLFSTGNQPTVFRHLTEWAETEGADVARLSLEVFPHLLVLGTWCQDQLLADGEFAGPVVNRTRLLIDDAQLSDATCQAVLLWCRAAAWDDRQKAAAETLLTTLAQDMRHGVLRLFVMIDRDGDPGIAGKGIARRALTAWRNGAPPPFPETATHRTPLNGRTL